MNLKTNLQRQAIILASITIPPARPRSSSNTWESRKKTPFLSYQKQYDKNDVISTAISKREKTSDNQLSVCNYHPKTLFAATFSYEDALSLEFGKVYLNGTLGNTNLL